MPERGTSAALVRPSERGTLARRAFQDAGRQARTLVRERGGEVTRTLDNIAAQRRGVRFADYVGALVEPMQEAGVSAPAIHALADSLIHEIVDALLRHNRPEKQHPAALTRSGHGHQKTGER